MSTEAEKKRKAEQPSYCKNCEKCVPFHTLTTHKCVKPKK